MDSELFILENLQFGAFSPISLYPFQNKGRKQERKQWDENKV